jgi:hypothetical protein
VKICEFTLFHVNSAWKSVNYFCEFTRKSVKFEFALFCLIFDENRVIWLIFIVFFRNFYSLSFCRFRPKKVQIFILFGNFFEIELFIDIWYIAANNLVFFSNSREFTIIHKITIFHKISREFTFFQISREFTFFQANFCEFKNFLTFSKIFLLPEWTANNAKNSRAHRLFIQNIFFNIFQRCLISILISFLIKNLNSILNENVSILISNQFPTNTHSIRFNF